MGGTKGNRAHGGRQGKRPVEGLKGQGESYVRRHAKAIVATSAVLLTFVLGVTPAGAVAPMVTIDPGVTSVSYTTAHVSGTVDPQDQQTYYSFQYSADPDTEGWSLFSFEGPIPAGAGAQNVSTDLGGLKPGAEYEVRLAANNFVDPEIISSEPNPSFTTDPVSPPSASIDPVTTITATSAHFSGIVDPEAPVGNPSAFDVAWRFECTPECPALSGGTIPADSTSHVVEADAQGLDPNTVYEVTLVASNAGGSVSAGPESFETDLVAPFAQTLYAGSIDSDSAQLAGRINPRNSAVSYQFEWGTDTSYGQVTPASPALLPSSDNSFHAVTVPISGLEEGTTYHFRIRATNTESGEESVGVDHVFTTAEAIGPPGPCNDQCRVYEKVSPSDKAGADIENDSSQFGGVSRASASGDQVAFFSAGTFAGKSGSLGNQYLSSRSPTGKWNTAGLDPTVEPFFYVGGTPRFELMEPDLAWSVFGSFSEGIYKMYLRDNDTGGITDLSDPGSMFSPTQLVENLGSVPITASAYSTGPGPLHIILESPFPLTDDSPNGAFGTSMYEWTDGEVRLVSVDEDGVSFEAKGVESWLGGSRDAAIFSYAGDNAISADGSRVFFSTGFGGGGGTFLHVRKDGQSTELVSRSERTGCDVEPRECEGSGVFQGASSDGSIAYFISGEKLTEDSTATFDRPSLYRWDAGSPSGERLTDLTTADPDGGGLGAGQFSQRAGSYTGMVAMTDDGDVLHFVASGELADGAQEGEPNLYRWDEESGMTFIATLDARDRATWGVDRDANEPGYEDYPLYRDARLSLDGSRLLFASTRSLTSYDVASYKQLYLYDADTQELQCVSCSSLTSKAVGGTELLSHNPILNQVSEYPVTENVVPRWLPRNMSSDGRRVAFDTSQPLVPGDSNGKIDVYEWSEGAQHLVSSGQADEASHFVDASASGNDVFFTTREPLVASDRDGVRDIYDAKVGGIPEPPAVIPCVGDECQGTPSPPPTIPSPGTESYQGPVTGSGKAVRRCSKRKSKRQGSKRARCKGKTRAANRRRAE